MLFNDICSSLVWTCTKYVKTAVDLWNQSSNIVKKAYDVEPRDENHKLAVYAIVWPASKKAFYSSDIFFVLKTWPPEKNRCERVKFWSVLSCTKYKKVSGTPPKTTSGNSFTYGVPVLSRHTVIASVRGKVKCCVHQRAMATNVFRPHLTFVNLCGKILLRSVRYRSQPVFLTNFDGEGCLPGLIEWRLVSTVFQILKCNITKVLHTKYFEAFFWGQAYK